MNKFKLLKNNELIMMKAELLNQFKVKALIKMMLQSKAQSKIQ